METPLAEIRKAEEEADKILVSAHEETQKTLADARAHTHAFVEEKKALLEKQKQERIVILQRSLAKKREQDLKKGKDAAAAFVKKASRSTGRAVDALLKLFMRRVEK